MPLRSRTFALLPHGSSFVDNSANAMEGDELVHQIGFYLHPAVLQTKDLISVDNGSVAWSTSIEILHTCATKFELWIMAQTKQ